MPFLVEEMEGVQWRIGGANVTLTQATVSKAGDTSSQDSANFYGMNAGALAEEGRTLVSASS